MDSSASSDASEQEAPKAQKRQRTRSIATPQAAAFSKRPNLGPASSGTSFASSASRQSSPTKRLLALSLDDDGIEVRGLAAGAPGLPPSLADLLREFGSISYGVGVMSAAVKDDVKAEMEPVFDWMFAPPAERDPLGPTPPVASVKAVMSWSLHCEAMSAPEHTWNCAVHFPLLSLALYGGAARLDRLVGFDPCMPGAIIDDYLPSRASSKNVDFCVYIDPAQASQQGVETAVRHLRRCLPEGSINHTDIPALQGRPIAVSIVTKLCTGHFENEAVLQIGTWQAAQWNMLSYLISLQQSPGEEHQDEDVLPPVLASLPFLPAIIIHDHDWYLAATSREGRKTIVWSSYRFGNTSTVTGIYQIVMGIQRLALFARETFWPWYQKAVLGLTSDVSHEP